MLQSEMPWIRLYTMQSSAKSLEIEAILSGRSLMNRRKSMDPSTDPWGTPLTTGTLLDELPSTTTFWVQPDRNDAIQQCTVPQTPKETFVWNSVEDFGEIQDQHVCLDLLVQ